ncbi:MAG: membrane protein insertion efficiency factor YidD, partial [Christensenellales bacterium]
MAVIKILTYPVKIFCLSLVYLYKILISPMLPKSCKFTPSCSTYAVIAIKRFGVCKGVFLSFKRILRCNHFSSKCGVDPVPDNLKGELKWV